MHRFASRHYLNPPEPCGAIFVEDGPSVLRMGFLLTGTRLAEGRVGPLQPGSLLPVAEFAGIGAAYFASASLASSSFAPFGHPKLLVTAGEF